MKVKLPDIYELTDLFSRDEFYSLGTCLLLNYDELSIEKLLEEMITRDENYTNLVNHIFRKEPVEFKKNNIIVKALNEYLANWSQKDVDSIMVRKVLKKPLSMGGSMFEDLEDDNGNSDNNIVDSLIGNIDIKPNNNDSE